VAGDKQHYIPQAVLRAFRANPKGKVAQVHVFHADRIYLSSTEGVAAQKFFFSERATDDGETLDAVMTRHENGPFNDDFSALGTRPAGPVDGELASRVLGHLLVRNHHLRGVMRSGASLLADLVEQSFGSSEQIARLLGAGGPSPTPRFRKVFSEATAGNALLASLGLPQPVLESLAYMMLRENRAGFHEMSDAARSLAQQVRGDAGVLARNAHVKSLKTALVPAGRVEALRRLTWRIVEADVPTFVLPDLIALGCDRDGQAGTILNFDEAELAAVLMPLSPTRMLIGEREPSDRDWASFNSEAVPHCLEFFVSAFRDAALEALASSIASRVFEPIQQGLAEAARQFRAQLEAPQPRAAAPEGGLWRTETAHPVELQSDFLDARAAARLATILQQFLSLTRNRFDISPLRRIAVAADYPRALGSIDRGALENGEPIAPSTEGWSAAYNVPVEEAGELGITMILHADSALMLLADNDLLFGGGASILLAQLARIGADMLLGTVFAGGVIAGDAHDRLLLPQILDSWKSYLVAGYQCLFSAELRPFYRNAFLERLSALEAQLIEHRRAYRLDGDVDAFLGAVIGESFAILNVAATAVASLAGDPDEDGIAQFKSALEMAGWANWFELLSADLAGIWTEGDPYPGQDAFLVLNRHVERLLVTGAIFLWDDGSPFGRVEVPHWSDWQWILEQEAAAPAASRDEICAESVPTGHDS
jgi:hypothetical protein